MGRWTSSEDIPVPCPGEVLTIDPGRELTASADVSGPIRPGTQVQRPAATVAIMSKLTSPFVLAMRVHPIFSSYAPDRITGASNDLKHKPKIIHKSRIHNLNRLIKPPILSRRPCKYGGGKGASWKSQPVLNGLGQVGQRLQSWGGPLKAERCR